MRLLHFNEFGELSWTVFSKDSIPPYGILSHTWGTEEVGFQDLVNKTGKKKAGYRKIMFCGEQATHDYLQYFWVDTCCIDKRDLFELSKAINSMFRWYQNAAKCYVLLSDVTTPSLESASLHRNTWEVAFRKSRWFTRGWTLQELIAPASVEFFSLQHQRLGDKQSLLQQICEITSIPKEALQGYPLTNFSIAQRMAWALKRETMEEEDGAYCLFGIFGVFMPLIYGEGKLNALNRLRKTIDEAKYSENSEHVSNNENTQRNARHFSKVYGFPDASAPRPSDIFIAVMGAPGSGKSTFISLCCDKEAKIGHSLQSGTGEVSVHRCDYSSETTIYLVDTPGFDHTNLRDTDVLCEIATWLTASYANRIKLNGIIYLHRIGDRMRGSAKINLQIFKKICGSNASKNIVLGTTMWDQVTAVVGKQQETELVNTPEFWGWMVQNGSRVHRHMNDPTSAMRFLTIFAPKYTPRAPVLLKLQEEMVDHRKSLYETAAGRELEEQMEKRRERLRKELAEVQLDRREALKSGDKEWEAMLQEHENHADQEMKLLDQQSQDLRQI